MARIIVLMDFSETSRNALRYALAFCAEQKTADILLLHITDVPSSYSGDGVAMAAISDSIANIDDRLQDEISSAGLVSSHLSLRKRALLGPFLKTLTDTIAEEGITMLMFGAPADFGEIWAWDTDMLATITELSIPVIAIPAAATFRPLRRIGFAAMPGQLYEDQTISYIRKLADKYKSALEVITVAPPAVNPDLVEDSLAALKHQLQGMNATYHNIVDPHIVSIIGEFVASAQLDLLIVRPRKHGIWYNLLHKSYSRELTRLNLIPVMALHDRWDLNEDEQSIN